MDLWKASLSSLSCIPLWIGGDASRCRCLDMIRMQDVRPDMSEQPGYLFSYSSINNLNVNSESSQQTGLRHIVDVHCHPTDAPVISHETMQNLDITICAMATRQ